MAAVAPAFDACGVRIAQDDVKGKVVYSERAIAAGEVIFSEEAFVFAPWSTNVCDVCEADKTEEACACGSGSAPTKRLYSELLTKDVAKRHALVQLMVELESVGEVDRARCVLKCLAMFEEDSKALDPILSLTCANYDQCLEDATEILEHAPDILPKGFSVDQLATLIGVLNTNSHELENLGGSGLFLSACRMEHNCSPNCSFTTYDSTLWMTAIRPIANGEPLSIDYGNFFYRPTEERLTSLLESYGFLCSCDACLKQPDTCRAFKCPASPCQGKNDSAVHPHPRTPTVPLEDPEELAFDWKCSGCGYVPSETEKDAFEAAEQNLLENGFPETLEEVDALIKTTPLHERHYLLFWALDAIGCEAAALVSFLTDDAQRVNLADVWKRIIASMNLVIPHAHHEKTIYYDNLAQVQVVLGDLEAAKAAYREAYEIACVVSGRECAPTQKLFELAQKPPANAEELRKVYANVKRREARDDDGEDEEEWEDEEDEDEGEEED